MRFGKYIAKKRMRYGENPKSKFLKKIEKLSNKS